MNWLSVVPRMAAQPLVVYTSVNCCGPLGSPCQVQWGVNSAAEAAAATVRDEPAHAVNVTMLLQQQQQQQQQQEGDRAYRRRHVTTMLGPPATMFEL
jgi:hypothetical protein